MKKCLLIAVLLTTSTFAAYSQRCIEGNCQNGFGKYAYKLGSRYVGSFQKGLRHGKGTLYYYNNNKYEGNWVEDLKHGQGTLTYADGDVFIGNFSRNSINGYGEMTFANGDVYKGNWLKDLMHGKGTYIFKSDKSYYVGEFINDKFNGDGIMYNANHSVLRQGTWHEGVFEGEVTENTPSEVSYNQPSNTSTSNNETSYPDCNKRRCDGIVGVYNYRNNDRFVGEFKGGIPHGQGTCYYSDGNKYIGAWYYNAPHGEGILYSAENKIKGAGIWNNGTLVKRTDPSNSPLEETNVQVDKNSKIKVWAVIVGIGRYTHMHALKYSDDDAYQMYAFLKSPQGGAVPDAQISVLIDEDATRNNIVRTMTNVFLKADENDVVMFYFSGHGVDGSFIPIDFDGSNNRLSHADVRTVIQKSRAKHKIIFADACHSGGLYAARNASSSVINSLYAEFEKSKGGIALMLSSKSEETSLEANNLRQGVYSHYLLRGLKGEADDNKNNIVTISELYKFVSAGVREYSVGSQSPTLTGTFDPNMPVSAVSVE